MKTTPKKSNRQILLASITAVIIIGSLIFTATIKPALEKRQNYIENLNRLKLNLRKMQSNLLIKDRIEKIYSQIKPIIKTKGTQQEQISDFTKELSDIYSNLNVKIRSVKILPTVKKKFYSRFLIKIEMSANITDFLKFAYAIQTHPEPIKLEQFSAKADHEIRNNVSVSLLISKVQSAEGGPKEDRRMTTGA